MFNIQCSVFNIQKTLLDGETALSRIRNEGNDQNEIVQILNDAISKIEKK